jgi:hypothetical protein
MITTHPKFKHMMALLTKHGLQGFRHRWCWEYSNGRTESAKELAVTEVEKIIKDIESHFKTVDKADVMRKKIIALAHQMRWELVGGGVDMKRVNNFCINYGYLKKPLNDYSIKELPLLITQFEKATDHFIKNL